MMPEDGGWRVARLSALGPTFGLEPGPAFGLLFLLGISLDGRVGRGLLVVVDAAFGSEPGSASGSLSPL